MKDPRQLGQDAVKATAAQVTLYETELTRAYYDNAVLPAFLGQRNFNRPGIMDISWKQLTSVAPPQDSVDGDEQQATQAAYTRKTNNMITTNLIEDIKYYDIQRANESNFMIETESAAEIGKRIAQRVDYNLFNGVDSPVTLTGIAELTNAQDAGNPTGVWDTTSNAYTDILAMVDQIRNRGWDGVIDALCTPGLMKIMNRFISDGTTTFETTVGTWFRGLLQGNGGVTPRIAFTSHFVTDLADVSSQTDKATGTDGSATNQMWLFARGAACRVDFAHQLQAFNRPVQTGDISRNYKTKYTLRYFDDYLVSYMNAIDATA